MTSRVASLCMVSLSLLVTSTFHSTMVSTRSHSENYNDTEKTLAKPIPNKARSTRKKLTSLSKLEVKDDKPETGPKRVADEINESGEEDVAKKRPAKKVKKEGRATDDSGKDKQHQAAEHTQAVQAGTVERGHIYFFYRPKVELEEVHSLGDVQRFHMLLVPRPPDFSVHSESDATQRAEDSDEMTLISEGADAIPAPPTRDIAQKPFRLIAIGKKSLPDPDAGGGGKGGGRKEIFWATISTVGDDLKKLEDGLCGKTYETKTRGTRHQGPARLAARGAYAIVNSQGKTPISWETHLGYHLSHPAPSDLGEVQEVLGIHIASSFVVQVKNPLAPNTGPARVGRSSSAKAEFPQEIMGEVFGKGGGKGRETYGLRFAPVERKEMLDYEGVELLFIAARSGEEGLESSLGEGRGHALKEAEDQDSDVSIAQVLKELAIDAEKIPALPLKGVWV
ncbi:hypothetical protein BXZ70DRAFT_287370 [Cristinia sonorae]|uniref:Uncharacterized protein n=1 Tax=Cristinia sonorae TaxID=1940300 RepID=A0A8K0UN74_9AGAR|nr:hypothetical protein BXZ70DRAFT_287370 [Cristinia sonorae]